MSVKLSFLLCHVLLEIVSAASVYDQSQTGKFNVQIDLKDLQVIALTKNSKEEYVDYDYAYDYSEMTIKPQNGTTPKPLNATSTAGITLKDNITITTAGYVETTSESINNATTESINVEEVTENHMINKSTTTVKSVKLKNTRISTKKPETVSEATGLVNSTNCNRGFILCDSQHQNKPLSILELLSQRFKRREHRKNPNNKQ